MVGGIVIIKNMKTKLHNRRKLIKLAHHRNGVCGRGFDVAIITEPDETNMKKRRHMLVVYFPGTDCACAAFDLEKLDQRDIAFGSNSWRGDHFADDMKALNGNANARF